MMALRLETVTNRTGCEKLQVVFVKQTYRGRVKHTYFLRGYNRTLADITVLTNKIA